jgi:signal transduction histidine kinase
MRFLFKEDKATQAAAHIIKRHGGSMMLDEAHPPGARLVVTLPRQRGMTNE